jgi:hypothetical protein
MALFIKAHVAMLAGKRKLERAIAGHSSFLLRRQTCHFAFRSLGLLLLFFTRIIITVLGLLLLFFTRIIITVLIIIFYYW